MRQLPFLRRLAGERRGATLIEFAIVAPVMILLMMGLCDLLYQIYAQSILTGAVQKAARDSGIQGGAQNTAAIDGKVVSMIGTIVRSPTQSCVTDPAAPTWCSVRKSYASFSQIAPEAFTDSNHNGKYDKGECFTDVNGNGTWDSDPGLTGQGGANDVTLYTFSVTYPRLFPMYGLLGWSPNNTINTTTLLKNQPYATQATIAPQTICK